MGHGLQPQIAQGITGLTLSVIGLSTILHGLSPQPLLDRYERQLERRKARTG